mmetsp:Transcript_95310/g.242189  ORF Transcript_95310/g.242189 Transcript_95310/m.242189 type:complete len:428 (-) Transcript_95310:213-1496(-)
MCIITDSRSRRAAASGAVVAVDVDILPGEVRAQHHGRARSASTEPDLNVYATAMVRKLRLAGHLGILEVVRQSVLLLPVQGEAPVLEDRLSSDEALAALRHGGACSAQDLADFANKPADVRVISGHCALEERPVDDTFAHTPSRGIIGSTSDRDADHVPRPLAIPDHLPGKVHADIFQSRSKDVGSNLRGTAAREQRHSVAGGLVTIHRAGVEAASDGGGQHGLQLSFTTVEVDIRQQVAEHGGHVGLDHASALGEAYKSATARKLHRTHLWIAVSRHNSHCSRKRRVALHVRNSRGHRRSELLRRQLPANDSGGRGQDARRTTRQAELRSGGGADGLARLHAAIGREDVADLVVDGEGLERRANFETFPPHEDRSTRERILREDSGVGGRGRVGSDHRQPHGQLAQLRSLRRHELQVRSADPEASR